MKILLQQCIQIIFLVCTILLYHTSCFSDDQGTISFDFRKTRWGMTKNEVKASESESARIQTEKKINESYTGLVADEVIVYNEKVAEMDVQMSFFFLNGSLVGSEYSFRKEYEKKNSYIDIYYKLRNILARKYGAPVSEDETWKDERFQKPPEFPSDPNHLSYKSMWETEKTEISLSLKTVFDTRYQVTKEIKNTIRILYASKNPEYLEDF